MKIIEPYIEILDNLEPQAIMRKLELCGRVCYKSEDKITESSAEMFLRQLIQKGHESVLEHFSFSVRFVCDRGVSHEIVRHRLASYCQESTRYCNYSNGRFNGEIYFIKPLFIEEATLHYEVWKNACQAAETAYFNILQLGGTAEEARTVLPNSLKTELIMTANIREWRHFLKMRTSRQAHPQMRQLAIKLLNALKLYLPALFDDIVLD